MSTPLNAAFAQRVAHGDAALIGFLPATYPTIERFGEIIRAGISAGLDAWEVWIDGEPPALEGEAIRTAVSETSSLRARLGALQPIADGFPVIAMLYGAGRTMTTVTTRAKRLLTSGATDLLVPDLPIDDQLDLLNRWPGRVGVFISAQRELDALIASDAQPSFVYLRSSSRPTGATIDLDEALERLGDVRAALRDRTWPIVVGFGVDRAGVVERLVAGGVDGIVVGSAIVRAASRGVDHVEQVIRDLRSLSEAQA